MSTHNLFKRKSDKNAERRFKNKQKNKKKWEAEEIKMAKFQQEFLLRKENGLG